MRTITRLCVPVLTGIALGSDAAPGLDPRIREVEEFVQHYHRSPAPDRARKELAVLLDDKFIDQPYFDETAEQHLKLTGHAFGLIARGKPELVRLYESKFLGSNNRGRMFLLEALCVAGDQKTLSKLVEWRKGPTQDMDVAIEETRKYVADPVRKLPRDLEARTATSLDLLWTDFFISGEYTPISRILDVLDRPDTLRHQIDDWLKKNPGKQMELLTILAEAKLARPGSPPKLLEGDLDLQWMATIQDPARQPKKQTMQALNRKLELGRDNYLPIIMKGAVNWAAQSNVRRYPRLAELLKKHRAERSPKVRATISRWLAQPIQA